MYQQRFMVEALELARQAAAEGEVPVGCVITLGEGEDARVVGRGKNERERRKSAIAHAEIAAIDEACRALGGWRLWQCELYVTLEPCAMCSGAIINAHLPQVYFGASDPKRGAARFFEESAVFRPQASGGYLADECAELLREFFRGLRGRAEI